LLSLSLPRPPPPSTLFPYTTLFRSVVLAASADLDRDGLRVRSLTAHRDRSSRDPRRAPPLPQQSTGPARALPAGRGSRVRLTERGRRGYPQPGTRMRLAPG